MRDNGYGMTRREVEDAYLNIAYNRRANGEHTPKGREVRGYRGIGKFAGLIAAQRMTVVTESWDGRTRLVLDRAQLADGLDDIEKAEITLELEAGTGQHGTVLELSGLRQTFSLPTRESLGRVLLREFRRVDNFRLDINGIQVAAEVLSGERMTVNLALPDGRIAPCEVWFVAKRGVVADPGILIRVGERAIGAPTLFGLEKDPEVPKSLLKRVYGEVNADHLVDHVLASWGGFVENSLEYRALHEAVRVWLKQEILQRRDTEAGAAPETFVESYAAEIERLPAPRREQARRALERVFKRFYDDVPDRRDAIARVVLEALESDEYWALVKGMDEAEDGDIVRLAELLRHWGLSEISALAYRARMRLREVDAFECLIRNSATLELSGVHKALQENIWLLGDQYEVMTSNKTLRSVIEQMLGQKYRGDHADKRPDLILAGSHARYLLVELKRPSHPIDHGDIAQALGYRDELLRYLPGSGFDVVVVGGIVAPAFRPDAYHMDAVRPTTFWQVVKDARERMKWLVKHLALDDDDDGVSAIVTIDTSTETI